MGRHVVEFTDLGNSYAFTTEDLGQKLSCFEIFNYSGISMLPPVFEPKEPGDKSDAVEKEKSPKKDI